MKMRKIIAAMLAAMVTVSMASCGKDKPAASTEGSAKSTTTTPESTTTASETTTTAAATTTTATETEASDTEISNTDAESVKVYYGWGQDEDEYTAEIFCPEGAVFDEYTLELYAEDGLVMSAEVIDEANGYSAISNGYWHPDAYSSEDPILSILQQL